MSASTKLFPSSTKGDPGIRSLTPGGGRRIKRVLAVSLFAILLASPIVRAEDKSKRADPKVLLERVRLSTVLQDYDLEGRLLKDGKKHPFKLTMPERTMRFTFLGAPFQDIQLELKQDTYTLLEVVKGKVVRVDPGKFGRSLRGTDITYEDLALRFLYWPNAVNLGEERMKYGRKAWKLRITNPGNEGPYQTVLVWIDKENYALMKLEGYDNRGGLLKKFEVTKVHQIDGVWFLKQMKMTAFNPRGAGKAPFYKPKETGRSYFEILKSTRKKGR